MANKFKEFKFDFNEDADPVSEIRRYRTALSKRYKTIEELCAYNKACVENLGIIEKDGKIAGFACDYPAGLKKKAVPAKPKKTTIPSKAKASRKSPRKTLQKA